jgi:hypothetical protein
MERLVRLTRAAVVEVLVQQLHLHQVRNQAQAVQELSLFGTR